MPKEARRRHFSVAVQADDKPENVHVPTPTDPHFTPYRMYMELRRSKQGRPPNEAR